MSLLLTLTALAISGGVDSMALAYLISSVVANDFHFKVADNRVSAVWAFIIDHGLRDGSKEEANTVAEWMYKMRIRARAQPITHKAHRGQHVDLNELSSFETAARSLRYRTLGMCATDIGASSLFSAHHRDDHYETLLMRLLAGHKYRGLQGIRAANPIPESYDLHGIYNSGLLDNQQQRYPDLSFKPTRVAIREIRSMFREDHTEEMLSQPESSQPRPAEWFPGRITRAADPHVPYLMPLPCEEGGVTLYRPMLEYDKDRLRATCEANKIPWVEDKTNSDPTVTTRNALRHIVRHHVLPRALQKPAILSLGGRAKRRVESEDAEAKRLLIREAVIKDFDTNVGTLLIELPTLRCGRRGRKLFSQAREEAWQPHTRTIAGLAIRKLMGFVTPENHLPALSNLDTAINGLLPELNAGSKASVPKAFSTGGVFFEPLVARGTTRWLLSRAPYSSRETRPHMAIHQNARQRCGPHGIEAPVPNPTPWGIWKSFHLFDGRFWVRMAFRLPSPQYIVRPYDPDSGKVFRRSLSPKQRARLERVLKFYAPGKVRTTLPAIYSPEETVADGKSSPEKPVLLALPTLRVQVPGTERLFSYEIRYRNVDMSLLGHRKKGDGVPSLGHRWRPSLSLAKRRKRLREGARSVRNRGRLVSKQDERRVLVP